MHFSRIAYDKAKKDGQIYHIFHVELTHSSGKVNFTWKIWHLFLERCVGKLNFIFLFPACMRWNIITLPKFCRKIGRRKLFLLFAPNQNQNGKLLRNRIHKQSNSFWNHRDFFWFRMVFKLFLIIASNWENWISKSVLFRV